MKKYLMGAAALALLATGCTKDLYEGETNSKPVQSVEQQYNDAFVRVFGQPDANQTWGFGNPAGARTRSITVNGDTYNKFPSADEVAQYFPTGIPGNAIEVASLLDEYKGKEFPTQYGTTTLWDIYAIYANVVKEGFNLKITQAGTTELGGNYQNASWDGNAQKNLAHPYNVYVDVDGDVTLKRVGATHFNLYILRGNVTLESNYGEQAGLISVAAGATLNDQRNSIAANQGVKIFNRGTINATNTEKYDIGNFCTVYNEGKFNVSGALTYSPGDGNDSYFMNLGDDAELRAPKMTLNSSGNFFNDGKVVIAGETNVTQKDIYWVNAGHYTTGTLTFSAKNSTFYNYCQLIVTGNAHMYDGEFNLMANSYTEARTAEMDNFIVNLGGNTGMYIKSTVDVKAQGDGTFQGFKNFGTNNYVLIGGKVTIASHRNTFSVEPGITYSVKQFEIVKGGNVVTEEYLQSIHDGDYPVLDLRGTECPYGQLTVTPNTNSCGATWSTDGGGGIIVPEVLPSLHVMAEDLSASEASDFDFNDVVMDVFYVDATTVRIELLAAGGTLPLRINEDNNWEVHTLFQVPVTCMVNTGTKHHVARAPYTQYELKDYVPLTLTGKTWSKDQDEFAAQVRDQIKLEVQKEDPMTGEQKWYEITATQGEPAGKIATPVNIYMEQNEWYKYQQVAWAQYRWAWEKQNIGSLFGQWVSDPSVKWYTVKED